MYGHTSLLDYTMLCLYFVVYGNNKGILTLNLFGSLSLHKAGRELNGVSRLPNTHYLAILL